MAFLSPEPVTMYLLFPEMSQLSTEDDSLDCRQGGEGGERRESEARPRPARSGSCSRPPASSEQRGKETAHKGESVVQAGPKIGLRGAQCGEPSRGEGRRVTHFPEKGPLELSLWTGHNAPGKSESSVLWNRRTALSWEAQRGCAPSMRPHSTAEG